MSINDEIAALGAQLETAILTTYTAVPSGGLASSAGQPSLAFLPGSIPVPAATFVQPVTGATPAAGSASAAAPAEAVNPMLVTAWLKAVGADFPLLLQPGQATVLDGPPAALDTMSDVYFDLLEFAQPLAAAGSPEAVQVGQLLSWARQALPSSSPADFPLLTQPADWPMNATYWTSFSYSSSTVTPPGGPPPSSPPAGPLLPVLSAPPIWRLRAAPAPVPVVAEPARPIEAMALNSAATAVVPRQLTLLNGLHAVDVIGTVSIPPAQTSDIQVTLDHMLVSIDRSSWWHNDWLTNPGWYVTGQSAGSSVGIPPAAGEVWGLPVGLILVQNLTLTGSWSAADAQQLTSGGVFLGPFSLQGAAIGNATSGVSISVPGPSVVALFCQPVGPLPPADPPPSTSAS